ncbi:uncharacterized protein LY79DRAFT_693872 [Colletotrichum navitas]|uniref:Uncharacterized protein n=1 Tax=Colletotrichum navitas TaxID=681940 RepID=A0AAD8PRR0_9PEZI|nr:uncharacterized protein LY79DRAFT_693872 [Colletotrichum navitas]KAK1579511.1 hypothetical protein LY79DRAFT_693872 [Colletotrichum navitas]
MIMTEVLCTEQRVWLEFDPVASFQGGGYNSPPAKGESRWAWCSAKQACELTRAVPVSFGNGNEGLAQNDSVINFLAILVRNVRPDSRLQCQSAREAETGGNDSDRPEDVRETHAVRLSVSRSQKPVVGLAQEIGRSTILLKRKSPCETMRQLAETASANILRARLRGTACLTSMLELTAYLPHAHPAPLASKFPVDD